MHRLALRACLMLCESDDKRAAPVAVVEDQEGVVPLLVGVCGIANGHSIPAGVHAPHPEFYCKGFAGEVLEVWQEHHLKHALPLNIAFTILRGGYQGRLWAPRLLLFTSEIRSRVHLTEAC